MRHESYWMASTPRTAYPPLDGRLEVEVAVLGGGIAGLTTAHELARQGKRVAVVEAGRIVEAVTGHTTAKVTSGHSLIYAYLTERFGADKARTYAGSQQAALDHIARTVTQDNVDCDFERQPNVVCTEDPETLPQIEAEVAAAQAAGLPASLVTETALPFPIAAGVRLEQQAQFHPRKYLLHLARDFERAGGIVVEHTRAIDVDEGEPCVVTTDRGLVRADHVVIATQLPFADRGLFFARAFPRREMVVAAVVGADALPEGMYITIDQPTRSVRTTPYDGRRLLVVTGEAYRPGEDEQTEARYQRLHQWATERFGVREFAFRWSAQDYTSADRVPYVGRLTPASRHCWVATGFGGWGMTNGTMSGLLLADLVLGRDNPWAALYDAQRLDLRNSAGKLVTENLAVARHFVGDRLAKPSVASPDELGPGEAAVVGTATDRTAAYRDEEGRLHAVAARCTHLGCLVGWNPSDRSWDCPCHGSRFDVDGRLLQGPATADLPSRQLSEH